MYNFHNPDRSTSSATGVLLQPTISESQGNGELILDGKGLLASASSISLPGTDPGAGGIAGSIGNGVPVF